MRIVLKYLDYHEKEGCNLCPVARPVCKEHHENDWADTKTTALTTLMEVEVRDLRRCVLCDVGGASGYSKTNYRKRSSIRWNSITCNIPFRLDMPSVSVLGCDVNRLLLLPAQNIRVTQCGDGLRRTGSQPCEVPRCGQIDVTTLYLGR